MTSKTTYQVIDIQTRKVVVECLTRSAANRSADIRDNQYGAVRFVVKPVFA